MQKIPTLFVRDENDRRHVTPEVTSGCEWVLAGEGQATRKYDGTCVMLDENGNWWARREVKPGKIPPLGFQPVESDTVCVPCRMAGYNPGPGGTHAARRSRSEARVSPPVVRGEGCGGSDLPDQVERQQELASGDLRDLRYRVPGSQGQEDLQQVMRDAPGEEDATEATRQSEAMASGSGKRGYGNDQFAGVSDDLSARSPAGGQEPVGAGAQGGYGNGLGSASIAWRDGASQERDPGRQPSGESGAVDKPAAARRPQRRVSALRDVHLCDVCGVTEVTGKAVGWEPIEQSPFAKYHAEALALVGTGRVGTFELIGPKVNGNPEKRAEHRLVEHAQAAAIDVPDLTFDGIRKTVLALAVADGCEGIVWHHEDGRMVKIKAKDFAR